jgi:branched-chain amino acid transport system ATP-binding protein
MADLLSIEGLETSYGASQALFGIDLAVPEGGVVALLGRNGMGKSTLVKSVMGLTRASRGTVTFAGQSVQSLPSHRIAQAGLGLVPEGRHVFPTLTVRENLVATARAPVGASAPWTLERIFALFPRMSERARQFASTLSGGEQQMLAIGRALMTQPRMLLLDEATEGLAPLIRKEIWDCLRTLKADGLSILIIDKNLRELAQLADRVTVLEKGRVAWEGLPETLLADEAARRRYLGV